MSCTAFQCCVFSEKKQCKTSKKIFQSKGYQATNIQQIFTSTNFCFVCLQMKNMVNIQGFKAEGMSERETSKFSWLI